MSGRAGDEMSDASELPHDTLLHKVQYAIANRSNVLPDFTANDCKAHDFSLDVTAAPTKIREIEALHTSICKLMQKGARISDILVVSPNLDSYRTAIKTIFDHPPEVRKQKTHWKIYSQYPSREQSPALTFSRSYATPSCSRPATLPKTM